MPGNQVGTDGAGAVDVAALANAAWVGASSVLIWMMVPGAGLLYAGLSRRRHALAMLWASIMAVTVVSLQWFAWGYTLAFAPATRGNGFLGTLHYAGMYHVLDAAPKRALPTAADVLFQGMFAMVAGTLMIGGSGGHARLLPMLVFLFWWVTLVYCPVACWTWNADGWLARMGVLDYAGGGPVHLTSGHAALVYALILDSRRGRRARRPRKFRPHSVTMVVLGTVFMWFGWFGFNGGTAGSPTALAFYGCVSSNLAAGCGAIVWLFLDYFRYGKKWTVVGLCSGAISGLVAITPAAGYVPAWASVAIGAFAGFSCNFAVAIKIVLGIDDGLDVYAIHGVGGAVGSAMTGLFACKYVNASGAPYVRPIEGGWLERNWAQLGYQVVAILSISAWSAIVTALLLLLLDRIPYLRLRPAADEQEDVDIHGINLFDNDVHDRVAEKIGVTSHAASTSRDQEAAKPRETPELDAVVS
ncbi:AFR037Wp [Eremothecium gossypii ATCC 10895]|uniref:Ammonium transporter n=1 Tax=Eremothecium gossypii (strain ATCC 10895 / CBS 109.51 / FGSC 9923 / NRRL Y-1056) TaxID=284811 RepID=Q754N5_EREGS|nr:AFR037Wp [Eremothecium gossypii ATCC 10895]AAS53408.2 AFR037Wp [Eremothecium gossypii ATCC 10895]AEY97719.1 FAFR037Wp [Eremothecium gossypii FDAG1]